MECDAHMLWQKQLESNKNMHLGLTVSLSITIMTNVNKSSSRCWCCMLACEEEELEYLRNYVFEDDDVKCSSI